MKLIHIPLMLLCTVSCVVAVCCVFPQEGVEMHGLKLHYLKLPDIELLTDKFPLRRQVDGILNFESRSARLAREMAEAEAYLEKKEDYIAALKQFDNVVSLPDSLGYDYFDDFFESLDSAEAKPVRVVYYGDSQLEEDRMTNVLRDSLQARFGGGGVGLVPASMDYGTMTLLQSRNYRPLQSTINAGKDFLVRGNAYGPCFIVSRITAPYHSTFFPNKNVSDSIPSRFVSRVKVLADNASDLSVTVGGVEAVPDSASLPMRRYVAELDQPVSRFSVEIDGCGDVYGMLLDGASGVSVDNVSLRGVSGNHFTHMDKEQLRDYLVNENVRLIILQYGCNQVPALGGPVSRSKYGNSMYEQIMLFKEIAPQATILFNGPQDMRYYHFMPAVVDTLRSCALRAGVAYWSMYDAMGGEGSMAEWQQDGLAAGDGIHFSRKGAAKMSGILYESLMKYYDYYKWKNQ